MVSYLSIKIETFLFFLLRTPQGDATVPLQVKRNIDLKSKGFVMRESMQSAKIILKERQPQPAYTPEKECFLL